MKRIAPPLYIRISFGLPPNGREPYDGLQLEAVANKWVQDPYGGTAVESGNIKREESGKPPGL